MSGIIQLDIDGALARVVLANPSKRNALDIAMWRELRSIFDELQSLPEAEAPRAVIVSGAVCGTSGEAGGQFASGGDIVEFASFRFNEATLRDFHENIEPLRRADREARGLVHAVVPASAMPTAPTTAKASPRSSPSARRAFLESHAALFVNRPPDFPRSFSRSI